MDHYKEELLVLKSEMFAQEVEIRNKVVNSYEELIKKRDNQYTERLEATKESIKRPYEARVRTKHTHTHNIRSYNFHFFPD